MSETEICGMVRREGCKDYTEETAEISLLCSQWEGWGMVTWEDVSKKEMTGLADRRFQGLWKLQIMFYTGTYCYR